MKPHLSVRLVTWATLATFFANTTWAGTVDLASSPLVTGLAKNVAPNIYFIFDDSLSMPSEYMPDSVNSNNARYCYRNFGHNTVYFNPAFTYDPPVTANGTSFADASFTAAKSDGFDPGSSTVNLSTSFRTGNDGSGQAAYYYEFSYTGNPSYSAANPPSTCGLPSDTTNAQRDSRYTKKTVTAAQQQNFANWYSYYRNRLLMMKTASGLAFEDIGDKYRVGFSTTSEKGTGSTKFLKIAKFNTTQKQAWYDILYATEGDYAGTPLRGALSKAGRYFAGRLVSGNDDPVQYSCQPNFTILTTDGFWNTSGESSSGTRYGAYQADNTTLVGDQDSGTGVPPPFRDSGAYSNTLSDVAMYYYKNDLRVSGTYATGGLTEEGTRIDVTTNNVPTTSNDLAQHQHMVTFTLGLGVSDQLSYPSDLPPVGSLARGSSPIMQGTKNWPNPDVGNTAITVSGRVDDLWHAAENGRGVYLSAKNPTDVVKGLSKALSSINAQTGSASAAATSTLQPVSGDNTAFIAQYRTVEWTGDILARTIDVNTGAVGGTNLWSAQSKLDGQVSDSSDSRNIYTYSTALVDITTKLKPFTVARLSTEIGAGYFRSDSSNPGGALSQHSDWSSTQKSAATDDEMIGFLRGRTGKEGNGGADNQLFRDRTHVLGDIVNSAPVFVRKPPFRYTDAGYAAFIATKNGRAPTVYAGSNDGMLHAFDATVGETGSGTERWSYIPSEVIKNLYKLADHQYPANHRFYVDGPLTAGDAWSGTAWATILVGGLGAGGKGYYALDVTDPANPKALWEFGTAQDADIGYSYGNPIITKRASDGKWVVLFASGYNNSSGDKKGRLFVVDAFTGAKLSEIITDNSVNNEDVSGIARIANYVEDGMVDNRTQYVYGGDLGGSLWRFDINAQTSQRLGRTSSTVGEQPITVRPELARIRDGSGNYHRVVYFGTGRFLGLNDVSSSAPSSAQSQAIYAVKDTGGDIGVFTTTATSSLVSQTLNTGTTPRTLSSPQTVDWATKNGWFITTPVGERFNVNPGLQLGVLIIAGNIPQPDYCTPSGSSILYQLDYKSGNVLMTSSYGTQIVGNSQVQTINNTTSTILVHSDGSTSNPPPPPPPPGSGTAIRVSWREIE